MKRSILVVDDESTARNMLRLILVRAGFEVMEAEDGYQALDQIERELPDLMVLDIMMPGIDGFEVCQRIRANRCFKCAAWIGSWSRQIPDQAGIA